MRPAPPEFRLSPVSYLVILLLGVAWPAASFYFMDLQYDFSQFSNKLSEIYYPTIALQLLTLLGVFVATRTERVGWSDLGLRNFNRWTPLQAAAFFIGANLVLYLLQLLVVGSAPDSFSDIQELLPKTTHERIVWLVLCMVVAISEEVTFRGYLLTRIARLTRGQVWIGVLLSSIAFASGHFYQGWGGFVLILVYGLMFSALYLTTDSLWPGITAHFVQDAIVIFMP
jgi:hypothetical protein